MGPQARPRPGIVKRTLEKNFDGELETFLESINVKYNYDFRHYSPNSLRRTIVQAMDRMGISTLPELGKKVLQEETFFLQLIQSLTIPVSEMFRDPGYYLALREKVIPHLKTYPSLKIWVAGCSTGEEVYSLAILLQEEELLERTTLYATDINPTSLEKAAAGIFANDTIQKFAQNYQESGGKRSPADYYTAAAKSVKLHPALSKNVTFADHSLVTDAVFSETHFISCRNVLIYFDRELQNRVIGLFRDSLCRKGFLGLGSKETLQFSQHANCFEPVSKKERIFQKT
jgi:chemotaxis protein methyltransferase CheR